LSIIIVLNKDKARICIFIILPLLRKSIYNIKGVVKVKGIDLSFLKLKLKLKVSVIVRLMQ
jgi:hypothetical protein